MGADRAIHIEVSEQEYENIQPIHVSKMLAKIAKDEKVDMVLVGKQVDNFSPDLFSTMFLSNRIITYNIESKGALL